MRGTWLGLVVLLGSGAISACGSDGDGGASGGAGGQAGTAGPASGGSAGTAAGGTGGGTAGSAGSAGTGGVGDAAIPWCGGETNQPCGSDQFCDYAPSALCGASLQTGLCKPRPTTCTDDCPGTCGCDGKFYCNDCMAQMSGVDESPDKSCLSSADAGTDAPSADGATGDAAADGS